MVPAALVLGTIVAGFWPTFGSDPLAETFPLEARGNIPFQVDAARFLEDGRTAVELAISVPEEAFAAAADSAPLVVEVEPLDERERSLARFASRLAVPPGEPAGAAGRFPVSTRWIRLRPPWIAGTAALRVRVESPELRKRGLLDRLRDRHPAGEAAARLAEGPGPAAPLTTLSDLLFVWAPSAGEAEERAGPGLRSIRSRLQPNPYRFYGRHQPILTVYWERYPSPDPAVSGSRGARVERWRIVSLPDTLVVSAAEETLRADAGPGWTLRRFDLRALPSGAYRLEVSLGEAGEPGARAHGDFQVVWEEQSWIESESELRDLGRTLLPAAEYEVFAGLDRGGKEAYLRRLWNAHAPTEPGRPNPLETKFRTRAAYAAANFPGLRRGVVSDRGRVYVRFGPPDEVRLELNPQDTELLFFQIPEEMRDDGESDPISRSRLTRRRSPADNRAYEIWEYDGRGDPLLPVYLQTSGRMGLKFIFVDELGDGDFVLAYTNVPAALQ